MRIELENGKEYLYQWDLNQRIILPKSEGITEVHFVQAFGGKSDALLVKTYIENDITYANIPNVILQVWGYAKVYLHYKADGIGLTQKTCYIEVRKRAKPSDYVYTEVEVLSYEALKAEINEVLNALNDKADLVDGTVPSEQLPSTSRGIKTVNGIAPDENGNIQIDVGGGDSISEEELLSLLDILEQ